MKRCLSLGIAIVVVLSIIVSAPMASAAPPVKLVLWGHMGWEVFGKEKACTVASKDECEPGKASAQPGGFEFPEDVSGAPNGNIYVADEANHRIQELKANGEFVLMFGREVNAMTGEDICTEEEIETKGVKCQAGSVGGAPDAIAVPEGVTVDPVTGNVYVLDVGNSRITEYTAGGGLVMAIGSNIKGLVGPGDLLAVGGPGDLLYVGEEGRIQKFNDIGESKGEISIVGCAVTAVAASAQMLYVVCKFENVVHVLNVQTGQEEKSFAVGKGITIGGIALDSAGHMAISANKAEGNTDEAFGYLYQATSDTLVTEFAFPGGSGFRGQKGIGFNGEGDLYASVPPGQEILRYVPKAAAETITLPMGMSDCEPGVETETSDTFNCTLKGDVDPWGVKATFAWFERGRTQGLGEKIPQPPIPVGNESGKMEGEEESLQEVSASVEGLQPNETLYDRLAAEDANVEAPEELTGATLQFTTPTVPPKVIGEPHVSFVKPSAAVLFTELNPEKSRTEYFFEYGKPEGLAQCLGIQREACNGIAATPVRVSSVYGRVGVTQEAVHLQPNTTYAYRLAASNEKGEAVKCVTVEHERCEGEFTTRGNPVPQAVTGGAGAIGTTSATIAGLVDPDGQPATYAFEVGVDDGSATQYGTVFWGAAGSGTSLAEVTFALPGLQPGTRYAYRIRVVSAYGTATGEAKSFETVGLPEIFTVPSVGFLPIPPTMHFPRSPTPHCKRGYRQAASGKCVKIKGKARRKRRRRGRG